MPGEATVADQILDMVRAHQDCTLDELIDRLQALNWSEVIVEVDRLSRLGRLRLTHTGTSFLTKLHAL